MGLRHEILNRRVFVSSHPASQRLYAPHQVTGSAVVAELVDAQR